MNNSVPTCQRHVGGKALTPPVYKSLHASGAGFMAPRSIRFFMTELDPEIGISVNPFDMGSASAFCFVVSVSKLVGNDSSSPGFPPDDEQASATEVVDSSSGTI